MRDFEERAKGILGCIFPDCDIFDCSTVHQMDDKRFPDFLISRNNVPVCLVDAKIKSVQRREGKYYLTLNQVFLDDYNYHCAIMGCSCAVMFIVSDDSGDHKGDVYLVENIKKAPFMCVESNSDYNDYVTCWYDISKIKRLVTHSAFVDSDKG